MNKKMEAEEGKRDDVDAGTPPPIQGEGAESKGATSEGRVSLIEAVRLRHIAPCIAVIAVLVFLLLWLGDPNDLHAVTFRNAFLGAGFVLLLKIMTAIVRSSDWDWLSLLDWKSPLMAILIQINTVRPNDTLDATLDFSGWATASMVAMGLFFAGFEGRATTSVNRAITATCGFSWAMLFALAAGYSDNFDNVSVDILKFGI